MHKQYPHYVVDLSRKLRKRSTATEKSLWQRLRSRQLDGLKFYRQFPIGRYIADFYCDELKLVVELEGGIHDKADQKEYDETRVSEFEGMGLTVMRIRNGEIENDMEIVLERIAALKKPSPLTK